MLVWVCVCSEVNKPLVQMLVYVCVCDMFMNIVYMLFRIENRMDESEVGMSVDPNSANANNSSNGSSRFCCCHCTRYSHCSLLLSVRSFCTPKNARNAAAKGIVWVRDGKQQNAQRTAGWRTREGERRKERHGLILLVFIEVVCHYCQTLNRKMCMCVGFRVENVKCTTTQTRWESS